MYDAQFTHETLYDVANRLQWFASTQESDAEGMYHAALSVKDRAQNYVTMIQQRLQREEEHLSFLQNHLNSVESSMSSDDIDTSEYTKLAKEAEELREQIAHQRHVVECVREAVSEIKSLASEICMRVEIVIRETESYKNNVLPDARRAVGAVRRCADAVIGYWDI